MDTFPSHPPHSGELQEPASDRVALASPWSARTTTKEAFQQAPAPSVDSKVQAQLSVILEGIGDAFYALDREWRFAFINRKAETYFGRPRETMLNRVIWDVFPASEGTELRRRYEDVFSTGTPASFETPAEGVPGRYLEIHVFAYDGGLGVSFRDWTERRKADEQLRETEARLTSLADHVPACMVYQLSDGATPQERQRLYMSKTCERLTGVPAEEAQANPILLYNLVLPKYREAMRAKEIEAFTLRQPFDMEFEMWHAKTGEVRWHRLVVTPRRQSDGGYVWDGFQIDITDHKRSEQHLRLLLNELNHRVKNTLATVQSLAAQSFHRFEARGQSEISTAYAAFEARLFALASGHDLLTLENWEGASLVDVVTQAFAPYREGPDDCRRIGIDGPDIRVTPPMALSLSMALHELCTNAAKYGALGIRGGRVLVTWETIVTDEGSRLLLRWEEQGGPPVTPPSRKGFGSRLIQKGLAQELNGIVQLAYEPRGVVCTINVPLP